MSVCCEASHEQEQSIVISSPEIRVLRDNPLYRCPNTGQIPMMQNGHNVFCATEKCPSGYFIYHLITLGTIFSEVLAFQP